MHVRPSILLFGDSITQYAHGEGTVKFGWGSLLASAYQRHADVFNRGFSGYNTRHALPLVPKIFGTRSNNENSHTIGTFQPRRHLFVTVFFGANDACIPGERQHIPLEEYGDNLTKIVESIRTVTMSTSSDFPIIIMTPPPIEEDTWKAYLNLFDYHDRRNDMARQYGLEAKRIGQTLNCPVLDTWELLGGDKPDYGRHLCDGLHLSQSGNELVFDGLMNLLKTEYPDLCPQELFFDAKDQKGRGLPPEEKLWDELC